MARSGSFARIYSAQPYGISGNIITVEVDVISGVLNTFSLIGVPDKSVEESRDRVGTALRNSGFPSPKHSNQKTVVSLLPAEIKKEGSYCDVAIAIGYLIADGDITVTSLGNTIFLGELSLNGEIQPLKGILPLVVAAKSAGFTTVILPFGNAEEASLVLGITCLGAKHLCDVVHFIDPESYVANFSEKTAYNAQQLITTAYTHTQGKKAIYPDISHIKGQELAKRALEIAASGIHSVALYGPPGTGKTMLARAFTGLLPDLTNDESIEVTSIHSITSPLTGFISQPQFRSPHHTSSHVAIIGGGSIPKPGEITLSHKGVLFLDEFPEFDLKVIESLRQPLEDKIVTVSRARGTVQFPADFILIIAMNPCPCGFLGSQHKMCTCSEMQIKKYRKKLSGPLVDRIDLWVPVEHISYEQLDSDPETNESTVHSADLAKKIITTRNFSRTRSTEQNVAFPNYLLSAKDISRVSLSVAAKKILQSSATKLQMSPRSYHRVIKIARTIADLDVSFSITERHILEALQFRPKPPIVDA